MLVGGRTTWLCVYVAALSDLVATKGQYICAFPQEDHCLYVLEHLHVYTSNGMSFLCLFLLVL